MGEQESILNYEGAASSTKASLLSVSPMLLLVVSVLVDAVLWTLIFGELGYYLRAGFIWDYSAAWLTIVAVIASPAVILASAAWCGVRFRRRGMRVPVPLYSAIGMSILGLMCSALVVIGTLNYAT